jgi:hypothetical protein
MAGQPVAAVYGRPARWTPWRSATQHGCLPEEHPRCQCCHWRCCSSAGRVQEGQFLWAQCCSASVAVAHLTIFFAFPGLGSSVCACGRLAAGLVFSATWQRAIGMQCLWYMVAVWLETAEFAGCSPQCWALWLGPFCP